jgi:MFS family permease
MGTAAPVLRKTFRSLGVPAYRLLWMGLMGNWMAMQMQMVARGYLAYELTHSAFVLGEVTLAMGLPRIVLSPVGGAIADRYPKKMVLVWSQALQVAVGLATAVLVWRREITIGWLLAFGFFQGAGFAINLPVRQALVPDLAGPAENLPNAIALNNAGLNMSRLVGPSVAGLLIDVPRIGLTGTFFACALAFAWSVVTAVALPVREAAASDRRGLGEQVFAGFRYLMASPALMALMALGFVALAVGYPYIQLMPVFALHVLRTGAVGLGELLTVVGLGGLFGTLATAYLSDRRDRSALQLHLGVAFGVGLLAFAAFSRAHLLAGAFAALFVAGFAGDSFMALNNTLVMLHTERAMYGRVMGSYMLLQSARQISVLPVGAVADAVGAPLTVGAAGALIACFIVGVRLRYPQYREIV